MEMSAIESQSKCLLIRLTVKKNKLIIIKIRLRSSIGNAAKLEAFTHICGRTLISRGKFNINYAPEDGLTDYTTKYVNCMMY